MKLWQILSDDEIRNKWYEAIDIYDFARAIEQSLKQKNVASNNS